MLKYFTKGILIVGLFVSCQSASSVAPDARDRDPMVIGAVEDVRENERRAVRVSGQPDYCGGVVFVIWPETEILRRATDGSYMDLDPDDLEVGMQIAGWSMKDVPITSSCPRQVAADAIQVLE